MLNWCQLNSIQQAEQNVGGKNDSVVREVSGWMAVDRGV